MNCRTGPRDWLVQGISQNIHLEGCISTAANFTYKYYMTIQDTLGKRNDY